jgi:uncharacterized protein YbjT (DUF2867 family)
MDQKAPTTQTTALTILGGTGHVGVTYINEFKNAGFRTRILARSPEPVARRFPKAEVVRGSMFEQADVAHAMQGVDAAFLITPIGGDNDPEPELKAARTAIAAAQATRLPHLVYASQVLPEQPTGVAILDAKVEIEKLLAASGVAWSSLCIGCYMDEWLGMAPGLLRLGVLLNPLSADRLFSFTCKQDVARVAIELVRQGRTLNGTLDVIEPTRRTLADAAALIGKTLGRKVVASGSWPLLPLMRAARPLLRRLKPVMVSKIALGSYFDAHGYVGNTKQMAAVLPGFEVTDLESYLRSAFPA